ncbi:MAG: hypothetical protein WCW52_12495, partial [Elusimicrobiales bacterium]
TCCGKLKNDDFKQNDDKWKMEHYDNICSTEAAGTGRYRPVCGFYSNRPLFYFNSATILLNSAMSKI